MPDILLVTVDNISLTEAEPLFTVDNISLTEAEPLITVDNISLTEYSALYGGFWQSDTGIPNPDDPSAKMSDNDYRELLRAKAVANTADGTPMDVYNFVLNGTRRFGTTIADSYPFRVANATAHCDVTIEPFEIFSQGERCRLNLHGPHSAATTLLVTNWTKEYLPFTENPNDATKWSTVEATIDGEMSKALSCDSDDWCYIDVLTQWNGLTASTAATGMWEWWYYKSPGGGSQVLIIASDAADHSGATQDGYMIGVENNGGIGLHRMDNGVETTLFGSAAAAIADNTWVKITVTRDAANEFAVYVDDVLVPALSGTNPVTDAVYTEGAYMVIDGEAQDQFGLCTLQTDNHDIKLFTFEPL